MPFARVPSPLSIAGNINTDATFTVDGLQVITNRGAAVADLPAGGVGAAAGAWDTAGNRGAAIASVNALLARLRAHGLIAP